MTPPPEARCRRFNLRTLLVLMASILGCREHHFGGMQDYYFPSEGALFGTMLLGIIVVGAAWWYYRSGR